MRPPPPPLPPRRHTPPPPPPGPDPAAPAVFLDNPPADRQPHPHAALPRGEERAEEVLPVRLPDPRPGILDDDPALSSVGGNPHGDIPSVGHRFDRVRQQVEHHPLHLGRVGGNLRNRPPHPE